MTKFYNQLENIFTNRKVTSVSANYTVLLTDDIIEVNSSGGPYTMTLPAPSTTLLTTNAGKTWTIKDSSGNAATNNITLTPVSGNIDGVANLKISSSYGYYQVYCDGTNYFSIASTGGISPTLNVQTFTSSGTYTPSANMQYAIIEMVGGGGGSGGNNSGSAGQTSVSGGGGGGGYLKFSASSGQIGSSVAITIGAAGAAGLSSPSAGGLGGTTYFGALASCTGGSGGQAGSGGTNVGTVSAAGGTPTLTTGQTILSLAGSPSSIAGGLSSINFAVSSRGGSTHIGIGGYEQACTGPNTGYVATSGTGFGSGAGGGSDVSVTSFGNNVGKAGQPGFVSVTEYIFAPPPLVTTASITWNTVTGTTQAMLTSNGYYTTNASATTLSLPTTAAAGTMIAVTQVGAGLWTISQAALQSIQYGAQVTTVGTGGSLVATNVGNTVWMLCTVANTAWQVVFSVGNITVN